MGREASIAHRPVLLDEVLRLLNPQPGERAVDLTLGRGGHARAILQRLLQHDQGGETGGQVRLLAVDRDAEALAAVQAAWPAPLVQATRFVHAPFSQVADLATAEGLLPADVVLADLGVSSPQLDAAARGFAFQQAGPLDMRMDATTGPTARDLLQRLDEAEVARVLWEYGEERYSRRIARAIKEALAAEPQALRTTTQLADLVRRAIPRGAPGRPNKGDKAGKGKGKARPPRIHPATRTFQALRIAVNDELGELEALLAAVPRLLAAGGRLAVIAFHSLEDRRVKHAFRGLAAAGGYEVLTRKPLEATPEEMAANPRARSAKLRVLRRLPG